MCYYLCMDEEVKVQEQPLSKKEQKKLAKKEKKEQRRQQKEADRAFERSHPLRKRKVAAWIVELVGFGVAMVPAIIIIGLFIAALFFYIVGAIVYIFLIFGLLCFGLGYIIYMSSASNPSLDGYFGLGSGILNIGNSLINLIDFLDKWFLTVCGGISFALALTGFILLMTSLSACTKKHKIAYIILMSLIMLLSAGVLAFGIVKFFR